jgi:hypothetical protein
MIAGMSAFALVPPQLVVHVSGQMTVGELIVGVGTVALAIFALAQIAIERRARKQGALRAQAERVSAWPYAYWGNSAQTILVLHNGSDEPVYRAIVSLVFIQGAAPRTGKALIANLDQFGEFVRTFTVIPPGRHYTTVPGGWAGMMRRPGVELAFVDRAGVSWLRSGDGRLSRMRREPADYYGLPQPIPWDIPSDTVPLPPPAEAADESGETAQPLRQRPLLLRRLGHVIRRRFGMPVD